MMGTPRTIDAARRPLEGHCALVTGSVQGIGLASVRALAALGAGVMLTDIRAPAGIDALLDSLQSEYKVEAAFAHADLVSEDAIRRLVLVATERLGPVDILVNNAAVRTRENVETIDPADWSLALAVNLTAPFHLIRAVLPAMRERGWGRIVNIASGFGLIASPRRIDYVTTKTGMIGMTKAIALDLAATAITCNAVCPGSTWTPRQQGRLDKLMAEGLSEDEARERLCAMLGTSRFLAPASIAAAVAYLCSEGAGEVTGVALPVDGGHVAGVWRD